MNSEQGRLGRAVSDVGAHDGDPADERERAVIAESATAGFVVGIYAHLAVALVAAVLGALVLPAVLLALLAVPAWTAVRHARRRAVDVGEIADRVGLTQRVGTLAVVFGGVLLTVAAMALTVFTGHGLVSLPAVDVLGPGATGAAASLVRGGVIGGLGGAALGLLAILLSSRQRSRRAGGAATPDEPDVD